MLELKDLRASCQAGKQSVKWVTGVRRVPVTTSWNLREWPGTRVSLSLPPDHAGFLRGSSRRKPGALCYKAKSARGPAVGAAVGECGAGGKWNRCKSGCRPTKYKGKFIDTVLQQHFMPLPDPFRHKNDMTDFSSTFQSPCRMSSCYTLTENIQRRICWEM